MLQAFLKIETEGFSIQKPHRFLKIENLTDFQYFKNEVFKISEHKRGDLKINRFLKIENLTDFQYNSFASWCEKPMKNIYFIEY